ncbi:PucR family transcriptional regulator [Kribbella catacumbae]|uniref:PucR family transcriptional regulator n=1 Tax=Kribbella catacumbae TaxID=460086 RepID=UPI00036EDCCE|nr:PucR family transcriptional regulator [Kribbella catacumbae]
MVDIALILRQRELGLRAVHLPRADRELRWVATSELEDPGPFLEGGELLLTTGLATKGWRSQWPAYVERLVEAGVAGLALGVGLTHSRVPAALVRACEQHGLNLIEVPRATAFVAVSRAAARLIEKRDAADARLALESQRQLTTAAMQVDASWAVAERLARLLDATSLLLSPDGQPVVGPLGPRQVPTDLEAVRVELARIRPQGLRAASTFSDRQGTTLLAPVGLRGRPLQYLCVTVAGRLTTASRAAVTTAVALLGLVAEQERDRLDTRRRLWRKVHELLAHGDLEAAGLLGEASAAPTLPRRVSVLRVSGPLDALEDALAELERDELLAAMVDGEVWVAASPGLAVRRAEELAAHGLRIGVGDSHGTAARALARTSDAQRVVRWERLVRAGAVGLLDPEVATAFAGSFLGSLDDAQVETLASFLRQHGSRLKVAEELGLHRNTVRNRLQQIEDALGRSLDDPDTRASGWLALQATALAE